MTLNSAAEVATIITPIAVGVVFIFAYKQLRAERKVAIVKAVESIVQYWNSKEVQESCRKMKVCGTMEGLKNRDYRESKRKDTEEVRKERSSLFKAADFFETLGLMAQEGALDTHIAYKLFGMSEKDCY